MATEKEWVLVFQQEWHLRSVRMDMWPPVNDYAYAYRNRVGGWSGEVFPTKDGKPQILFSDNYNLVELKELLEVTVAMRGD